MSEDGPNAQRFIMVSKFGNRWMLSVYVATFIFVTRSEAIVLRKHSHDFAAVPTTETSYVSSSFSRRNLLKYIAFAPAVVSAAASPCCALSPKEAETQYDRYAATYDQLDGGVASSILGIDDARTFMIRQAKGNVLEIGVGTGLNLDKYDSGIISSLTLVDISEGMLREAVSRAKSLHNLKNVQVTAVKADATSELVNRFGDGAFDTVVDSFSLCVMGNEGAVQCLDQISKVVKQGQEGQVLLLENSRSSNQILGLYQDATADVTATAGGKGCVYNQDVEAMVRRSGRLTIQQQSTYAAGLFRFFKCVRK